jgi:branched-chain amino acid transport system substrate-binding protein
MSHAGISACRSLGRTAAVLIAAAAALALGACGESEPILLGFSGTFTGKYADLGVQGRNGAQLAVETINQEGGVAGRPIKLLVENDNGTVQGAIQADTTLIDQGAAAIVGHMTSSQSLGALPTVEQAGLVLFSPSSSTPKLKGRRDAFFRTATSSDAEAAALGEYMRDHGVDTASIVLDVDNEGYTGPYAEAFAEAFTALGGRLEDRILFSSSRIEDWDRIVSRLKKDTPEALLIVASSRDTATLAQRLGMAGVEPLLFGSGWARTGDLPKYGGKTVEGMIFGSPFDAQSQAPAYLEFQQRYKERFGAKPTFAAVYAYEAVLFLAQALEQTGGDPGQLKEALPEVEEIQGLMGPLALDEYGDIQRSTNIEEVKNGEFVVLEVVGE